MSKKLGDIKVVNHHKPLWLDLWSSKRNGKTYITLYFTHQFDPNSINWIVDLADELPYPCKTKRKGTFKHGFYWKVYITVRESEIKECIKRLNDWTYDSISIEITKDVDDLISSELAKLL